MPGTPSLLRAINERTILEYVHRMGTVSRSQIARHTGLSKPTVSQAMATLLQAGLLREAGRSSGSKGPAARLYELDPMAGRVVGIDVGRDMVRAALADLTGEIVARRDERARVRSTRSLIEQIGHVAHALAAEAGLKWRQVAHATVGTPGVVRPEGRVALAYDLPGWGREGLIEAVRAELGTNVSFENDVNLAAMGERSQGLGKDVPNFAYLHVGTGVGMGVVIDGELYRGATGAAGEVGYLPLGARDVHDTARRKRGALEEAIGSRALLASARELGLPRARSVRDVVAAARRGDEAALAAMRREAEGIALAVASVVPVVDPELVVLGGEVGRHGDLLLESVEEELGRLSPFHPRVEVSSLGEEGVLHGAVGMALQAAMDRLFSRQPGGGIESASRGGRTAR